MRKVIIEATDVSPEVILDIENDTYLIKGKSIVSEVDNFYNPILNWLKESTEYIRSKNVSFVFDLEYFNIFSSKRILFLLYQLSDMREQGININVVWHFSLEDDDMKEVGEDFACMINVPFEFVSKSLSPQLI